MLKILAVQKLKPFSKSKISKVYDNENFPHEAILTLCPTFEYPDWDYQTIGYFLSKH